MSQPIILSAHDTVIKLLSDRSAYMDKWLDHVKADPDVHSVMQFPVPGQPMHSHYYLVEKAKLDMLREAFGNGAQEAADYLARCPQILIQQSVATSDPAQRYRQIRNVSKN